jgi:GNAT superfamily N-acetyltransferase
VSILIDHPKQACHTVREATAQDVPVILSFIRDLAEYEKLLHEMQASEEQLAKTLFCEKPVAKVLLAEVQNAPAGFALYFYNYSTFLGKPGIYLEDLFVKPEYRGQGIGKDLLTRLAQTAVQEDCGRLEWRVLDWNEPSIAFYKSLGAVPLDEWTIYSVSGDALQMLGQ